MTALMRRAAPVAGRRLLVIYRPGAAGEAAVRRAAEIAGRSGAHITIGVLAGWVGSVDGDDIAVPAAVATHYEGQLARAREFLGPMAAHQVVIAGRGADAIASAAGTLSADMILMPDELLRDRLLARRLRKRTCATVV